MSLGPIPVSDIKLEATAKTIADELGALNVNGAALVNVLTTLNAAVTTLNDLASTLKADQGEVVALLTTIVDAVSGPSITSGMFNPPPALVKVALVEVPMSVMQLEVGQTATGAMTFDEPTPPADGAVVSDNAAVATIALAADHVTWTCVAVAVGTANISYTGTSAAPDVGAAVVPPMVVTVVAVPLAEHGDFNPTGAVITGP